MTARLLLFVALGYVWGAVSSQLPAPVDPDLFWIGNLAAPYVLLPFLAGAAMPTTRSALLAGALTAGATVAGFYGFLFVGDVTNSQLDLPVTTTARAVVLDAYRRWLSTFLLGQPGGIPWLTIGLVVGMVAGWLGDRWQAHGATWAGVLVASLLVLEPGAYLMGSILGLPMVGHYSLAPANLVIWGTEAAIGVAVLFAMLRHRTHPRMATTAG